MAIKMLHFAVLFVIVPLMGRNRFGGIGVWLEKQEPYMRLLVSIKSGVSFSTIEKITSGKYPHRLKEDTSRKLLKAIGQLDETNK